MTESIVKVKGYINPTRLDRFLREQFKGLNQGLIEKGLRKGNIKVDGKKQAANYRVQNGDEIKFIDFKFEEDYIEPEPYSNRAVELASKLLGEYKIFENEHILVINKPAGLAVQGGTKVRLSVDDALQYLNQSGATLKLTHRLDKDTSGLLLIAQNRDSAFKIFNGFKSRIIKKKYLAMLDGVPQESTGQISSNIGKVDSKNYQKVAEDDEDGKLAITDYKVLKVSKKLSLVEFEPHTGRMHQLRFHAQSLGCPIIGDNKYGSKNPTQDSDYLYLHATELTLPEEVLGELYSFKAPMPEYWDRFPSSSVGMKEFLNFK